MREWNADESFKSVHIGIVVAFVLSIGLFFVIEITVSSTVTGFLIWVFIAFLIILGTIFPLLKRQSNRLKSTHKGYNQNPIDRDFFWFGSSEYNRYRIDDGVMQGMTIGYDPHLESLDRLERKQRESKCEVCRDSVYEAFDPNSDSFYVVENRKVYRFFGIPIREKVLGWDAYCSEHKPKEFK
jgi:hypothetical protein